MRFKTILYLFILIGLSTVVKAQTQAEMNAEANANYKAADTELNNLYQQILKEYKTDTEFIKNLKASQRIWITFRDAELKTKYPNRPDGEYGSIHPMCVANYLEQLTLERIATLSVWIDGIEEGDACAGSVKIKTE